MFTKRLKLLMKKNNLDEKKLAKELGLSLYSIKRILQGKIDPKAHVLIRAALYFSCTVDFLVGFSDNEKEYSNIK